MNEKIQRIAETNPAYGNIIGRTSVRRYTDEPVDAEQVEALCAAAMSAPSGVNKQPWELIVVDDRRLLAELAAELPLRQDDGACATGHSGVRQQRALS